MFKGSRSLFGGLAKCLRSLRSVFSGGGYFNVSGIPEACFWGIRNKILGWALRKRCIRFLVCLRPVFRLHSLYRLVLSIRFSFLERGLGFHRKQQDPGGNFRNSLRNIPEEGICAEGGGRFAESNENGFSV